MNLNITLSPESVRELKATVLPTSEELEFFRNARSGASLFGPNVEPDAIAEKIFKEHGDGIVERIIEEIDNDDLHSRIAENICPSDIADNIDASDVARELDIDLDDVARRAAEDVDVGEIADRIADNVDLNDLADRIDMTSLRREIADHLDLDELAQNINVNQIALQLVKQFVQNQEFRECFMEALLVRLSESVKQ